jgi:polyhydroxyalkanoate synthase
MTAAALTPPRPRLGPRPLPLHLTLAGGTWLSSLAALPLARSGSLAWSADGPAEAAAALAPALASAPPEALARALGAEVRARLGRFLDGIAAYRAHPYRRAPDDAPVAWSAGSARLFDYGPGRAARAAVMFVPSLINRAYVLDLLPDRSLVRFLAASGVRTFLLDWGAPDRVERGFALEDYLAARLRPALEAAVVTARRPVVVAGYCMGGLFALPLALAAPSQVAAAVFLAVPWNFSADGGRQRALLMTAERSLDTLIDALGELPTDLLQALFTGLDPLIALRKFTRFATLDQAGAEARAFVALEDWLNDGVPLAGPVARQCLFGWYRDNLPGRGAWCIDGLAVRPEALAMPSLVVVPAEDRIVPPPFAEALAAALPAATVWRPPLGHIGMVASARAERAIYAPLARWLLAAGK